MAEETFWLPKLDHMSFYLVLLGQSVLDTQDWSLSSLLRGHVEENQVLWHTVLAEFPPDTQHWLACHVSGPSWKYSIQLPIKLPQLMSHLCQTLPKFQTHEQNEWLLWGCLLHSNRQLTQYITNINLKGSSTKGELWKVGWGILLDNMKEFEYQRTALSIKQINGCWITDIINTLYCPKFHNLKKKKRCRGTATLSFCNWELCKRDFSLLGIIDEV